MRVISETKPMSVCFVLPTASVGGGTYTVLQHASHLAEQGAQVSIVLEEPLDPVAQHWHPALQTLQLLTAEQAAAREFDIAIATFWTTVPATLALEARRHVYFVQSIESRFYPLQAAEKRAAADATYDLGLPVITEAQWIKARLESEHGANVWLAHNGVDGSVFTPDGPLLAQRIDGLRVIVEGPLGVEFKNVPRAIRLARDADVDELWLLTSSRMDSYPGVDKVLSRVSMRQAAEAYRSCDVLLKLSLVEGMFGPPLEMFCCGGTAIVYKVNGFDEYIIPGQNAVGLDIHDEAGVVAALRSLKSDAGSLARLKAAALATGTAWPSWSTASSRFAECLGEILADPRYAASESARARLPHPIESGTAAAQQSSVRTSQRWPVPTLRRAAAGLRLQWWAHVSSRRAPSGYAD